MLLDQQHIGLQGVEPVVDRAEPGVHDLGKRVELGVELLTQPTITAVVDGLVEGSTLATGGLAMRVRRLQNGFVRSYAASLFGGALLVVLALLAVNLA